MKATVPSRLCGAFAALIHLYIEGSKNNSLQLNDDPGHIEFFRSLVSIDTEKVIVVRVLSNKELWKKDLSNSDILVEKVTELLNMIRTSVP